MTKKFVEYFKARAEKRDSSLSDNDPNLDLFNRAVLELSSNLHTWLQPSIDEGLIRFDVKKVTMKGGYGQAYEAPEFRISAQKDLLLMKPVGFHDLFLSYVNTSETFVARYDFIGKFGKKMLLYTKANSLQRLDYQSTTYEIMDNYNWFMSNNVGEFSLFDEDSLLNGFKELT